MYLQLKSSIVASLTCLSLAACGGGGGSSDNGGGNPNWSITAEYNRNYGLNLINAEALFLSGATGQGMTVAIIDTGIDMDHPEFAGRINPLSYDVVNDRLLTGDVDFHGTWVAGVVGANLGTGDVQGVAYGVDILAINAATPNLFPNGEAGFYNSDTAAAIRYAVDNNADVINMSLGGGSRSQAIADAIKYAADNGVIVVIATGNASDRDGSNGGGSITANISNPAYEAGGAEYAGHVIAVGSVGSNGIVSDFSSACNGRDTRFCLVAPGSNIYTTRDGGGYSTVDGTSFAAPHVAGALALLMDAFPNLTGAQAVQIILETAFDRGQVNPNFNFANNDYGNGLLDLQAAMGPSGSLSTVAGDLSTDISTSGLELSSAFGNALSSEQAFANLVLFDFYEREYRTDITDRIKTDTSTFNVTGFSDFDSLVESTTTEIGATKASFSVDTIVDDFNGTSSKELIEFSTVSKIDQETTLGFSYGGSNTKNVAFDFVSNAHKTYSLTDSAVTPFGFMTSDGQSVSLSRQTKGWTLSYGLRTADTENSASYSADFKADKKFINGTYLGLRGSFIFEDDSFLGATATGAFNGGYSATTTAVTLAVGHQFQDLTLFGQISAGSTNVRAQNQALLSNFGTIRSQAAMLGVTYDNFAKKGDSVSFIVSRPLRVTAGDAQLNATVAGDDNTSTTTNNRVGLSPTGSQINFELGYRSFARNGATWGFGLAYVIDPNHDASADAQVAAGITYKRAF